MKKFAVRAGSALLFFVTINFYALSVWTGRAFSGWGFALLVLLFFAANLRLPQKGAPSRRIKVLDSGGELLKLFLAVTAAEIVFSILFFVFCRPLNTANVLLHLLSVLVLENLLFWNGMLRVYLTSVQLGIKWRVIGALCGWIPLVHLWALGRILRITGREVAFGRARLELNAVRAENEICATRYPILLVHGVFFRDSKLLDYWGRIPAELKRNGAAVYYGGQQSAASVADSGAELTERIRQLVRETGCEKVNLIAHSKGGLDCRYAITHAGAGERVASLTTVNTPHRGCLFADELLGRISARVQNAIARRYNRAARLLGDREPDFLRAVRDLTASSCARFNEQTPDLPGVLYQSVGSVMRRAASGKFPLNMTYPLVRHFDGENDGLVAVESMPWGEAFRLVRTEKRGVSHADMIDLNRENIPDFDVREFYVQLVSGLKARGL